MDAIRRRLFITFVSVILALLLMQLLHVGETQARTTLSLSSDAQIQTSVGNCSPCYYFYGSNHSWMYTATNDWYQHQGNWCGIANIRAIQVYDWLYYGNHGGSSKTPQWD